MLCTSSILWAGSDPGSELSPESPTFVLDCSFQEKEEKGKGREKAGGGGEREKRRGGKGEIDLMLMQCGLSNSRNN